jgi:hypothetical protein
MNDTKINLTRITPICIDGREIEEEKLERYRSIIKYMISNINFHEIVFIGTRDLGIEGIRFIKINHISIGEYSRFCIKELDNYYSSDFCLVFQDDGFIVNPNLWSNTFYDYDYIGAPWPLYIGWPKEGMQVGNGGFSLRSRKFTQVSSNLPDTYDNEDTYILITNRNVLNDKEIKIAPVEIARDFAVEVPLDENHSINNCFGFHAKHLLNDSIKYINEKQK